MGGVGDKCLEVKIRQKDDRYGQRGVKNKGEYRRKMGGGGKGKKWGKRKCGTEQRDEMHARFGEEGGGEAVTLR